jgi:hypothetical protein
VDNQPVGSNSPTFTTSSLTNGQKVTLIFTSSVSCALPVTSNTITMAVNDLITPSVTIAESVNNICPGTTVTFTATRINGGTPSFQW